MIWGGAGGGELCVCVYFLFAAYLFSFASELAVLPQGRGAGSLVPMSIWIGKARHVDRLSYR